MANNALLQQAATLGDAQGVGVLRDSMAQGQNMAAQRQNMQQNALKQDWATEDRGQAQQQAQQEKQLQQVREDYAQFMSLPDDNARTQAWQSGLAEHYGQDPASDWRQPLMQLTQQPGFLPPEVAAKIIEQKFAPKRQGLTNVSPGGVVYDQDARMPVYTAPRAPEKPDVPAGYRPTPTGLEATPGGPADPKNPLNANKTASGYTPKEISTARQKLLTIKTAQQQLDVLKAKRDALLGAAGPDGKRAGSYAAGPFGAGMLPTEAGKNYDAAVDQLRSSITGLKRVPGVGAMSDYETRLDQSMLPARGEYESSIDQKIDGIQTFLDSLNQGYSEITTQENLPGEPAAGSFRVIRRK